MTEQPNILLIVLDAVRRDHCSCYGYRRNTTPHIDNLAADGIKYTNTFTNSNWTPASHAAIFTGYPPSVSGVYGSHQKLPDELSTLPELLSQAGYYTFGTSAGAHLISDRGYSRGFNEFHQDMPERNGIKLTFGDDKHASLDQFIIDLFQGGDLKTTYKFNSLMNSLEISDGPFFGFINVKNAHAPYYINPEPYLSNFCGDDSILPKNTFSNIYNRITGEYPDTIYPESIDGVSFELLNHIIRDYPTITGEYKPSEDEWSVIKSIYDGAIKYMDYRVGKLVSFLKEKGEYENTCLIITSDHGEQFGEHGLQSHVFSLFEELLEVPLIIKPANHNKPHSVSGINSLNQLFPTILEIADSKFKRDEFFNPLHQFDQNTDIKYVFAEVGRKDNPRIKSNHADYDSIQQNGPIQSIRDENYKLIMYRDGSIDLYDWRSDPDEQNDISVEKESVVNRLMSIAESKLGEMDESSWHKDGIGTPRPEIKKRLVNLGYLSEE